MTTFRQFLCSFVLQAMSLHSIPPPVTWIKSPQTPDVQPIIKQPIPSFAFFPAVVPDLSTHKLRTDYMLDNRSWEYPFVSRPELDLSLLGQNFQNSFLNTRISQAICRIERLVVKKMVGNTNSKQGSKRPFTVEMMSEEEWKHLIGHLCASAKPTKSKTRAVNYFGCGYSSSTIQWSEASGLPELNSGLNWYIKKYVQDYEDCKVLYRGRVIKFQLIFNNYTGQVNCKFTWDCKTWNDVLRKWQ